MCYVCGHPEQLGTGYCVCIKTMVHDGSFIKHWCKKNLLVQGSLWNCVTIFHMRQTHSILG